MSAIEIQQEGRVCTRPWRVIAMCLAFAIVFLSLAGFVSVDSVHNAAHDSRHTAAFPCH